MASLLRSGESNSYDNTWNLWENVCHSHIHITNASLSLPSTTHHYIITTSLPRATSLFRLTKEKKKNKERTRKIHTGNERHKDRQKIKKKEKRNKQTNKQFTSTKIQRQHESTSRWPASNDRGQSGEAKNRFTGPRVGECVQRMYPLTPIQLFFRVAGLQPKRKSNTQCDHLPRIYRRTC